MILNVYLLCFIVLFFGTINALPVYRYRRQINSPKNSDPYDQPSARISGSIVGTYYYGEYKFHKLIIFVFISFFYNYIGIGSDPNYGSYISRPNSAHSSGVVPISYNSNSNLYGNLIKPNYIHQQQQRQDYMYNNNRNNGWQRQNMNNNYNSYSNRYPPGSRGWYATGGNYLKNNG
jgi:hypothetical protein